MFSDNFVRDLASVWSEEGRETTVKTARNYPAVFFATCARLLPNDVRVTVEQSLPGNLSPSDWADLRELLSAIQSTLPDAADRAPGEVFQIVRDALGKPQGNSLSEIEPAGN